MANGQDLFAKVQVCRLGTHEPHTALVDCLADYCRRHELTLCGAFTDREATSAVRSPAIVGLLGALELPDTVGEVRS